jgi:hypothetical protein
MRRIRGIILTTVLTLATGALAAVTVAAPANAEPSPPDHRDAVGVEGNGDLVADVDR